MTIDPIIQKFFISLFFRPCYEIDRSKNGGASRDDSAALKSTRIERCKRTRVVSISVDRTKRPDTRHSVSNCQIYIDIEKRKKVVCKIDTKCWPKIVTKIYQQFETKLDVFLSYNSLPNPIEISYAEILDHRSCSEKTCTYLT